MLRKAFIILLTANIISTLIYFALINMSYFYSAVMLATCFLFLYMEASSDELR